MEKFIIKEYGDSGAPYISSGASGMEFEEYNGIFKNEKLEVKVNAEKFDSAVFQTITVKNISNNTVKLKHVSSAYVSDIGEGAVLPWYDKRRFVLHYCFSTWQGEAQWRRGSLADLGLYNASNHKCSNVISIRGIGNQSTNIYYPIFILEDRELGKAWFFETETASNWYMEIGVLSGGLLYAEMNGAFYNSDNWSYDLESGQEYTTIPCVYGNVDGDFEEAVKKIIKFKRKTANVRFDDIPAVFNDYMNCLWANPDDKKLIPLIDSAAEVGCEVFCIDAGWYRPDNKTNILGDWEQDDSHFGKYGFDGIINYIKSKGMKPGIWLEIDSVTKNSKLFEKMNKYLLTKNGEYAGSGGRCIIDFTQKEVRDYFMSVFDRFYQKGVRFIKNDFNQTSGIGYDGGSEKLRQCSDAFNSFIFEVELKYPDLYIENCGSGALRSDGATMRNFYMMSTSDQEYYYNNPSIISGTMAYTEPEKCGIWSYPYPLPYEFKDKKTADYFSEDILNSYADGEETSFNMITSILGAMYLSGHIEYADEKNMKLIKDAYPIYPSGTINMEEKGFYCFGLQNKNKIILAVWRINSSENTEIFDLSKYAGHSGKISQIYPDIPTEFNFCGGKLSIKLDKNISARLFEILI